MVRVRTWVESEAETRASVRGEAEQEMASVCVVVWLCV